MSRQVTREELYDLAWSEPMSRLAEKFGVSDVALAKACRRADIPLPGLGYWAKLQHGKKVTRKPLPPLKPGTREIIRINPPPPRPTIESLPPDLHEQIAKLTSSTQRIAIPRTLANTHPIVRAWNRNAPGRRPKTERRRLLILSTLFKEFEGLGYSVRADPHNNRDLWVTFDGEKIEFRLRERQRKVRPEFTPEEKRFSLNFGPGWNRLLQPTGQLTLEITSWVGEGARRQWSDTDHKPLEKQLNVILAGFVVAFAMLRKRRLGREEERKRTAAAELDRQRREEVRRAELRRFRSLLWDVKRWSRAAEIRVYVQAAVRAAASSGQDSSDPVRLEQWASWALGQADRMDPLILWPLLAGSLDNAPVRSIPLQMKKMIYLRPGSLPRSNQRFPGSFWGRASVQAFYPVKKPHPFLTHGTLEPSPKVNTTRRGRFRSLS